MVNLFAVAFLTTENQVILARRHNTDFGNGLYSMVGGKVESGETARKAVQREVFEEIDLRIPEENFSLVHVLHRQGTETAFMALCFSAPVVDIKAIYNKEPHRHDDVRSFALAHLPENLIDAHKQIIDCIQKNIIYSEHGWPDQMPNFNCIKK